MRKNRLMWIIALFLIIIAALPVAYAQFSNSVTGSRISFILINAAIIFAVLFTLQLFLIPQKNDKEKTSVWVIMLLASLIVGYLYGQNGFLWQGPLGAYFNIYILVNSAIIAAVLYFALGFLKIGDKLKSPEGNAGYGLLIFLFSVMISINIAPGMFLWKQEFIRSAAGFLFSSDRGILNPKSGLMVFVTSFILISFFFNGYLLKQGDKKLNYALALIFAVNLAIPPVNPIRDVIQMGEIMFILIVWETLKTTVPSDKPWAALLLAILLVGWASAALSINSPQNRGAVAQFTCNTPLINCKTETGALAGGGLFSTTKTTLYVILGGLALFWMFGGGGADKKKYSGWGIGIGLAALILVYMWNSGVGFIGKIGLGLASILVGIGVILYFMGKGEKRAGSTWKTLNKFGISPFMEWLRKSSIAPARAIVSIWTGKDPYEEGKLPKVFKSLRAELMTLMNYQTRVHTYFGKRNGVVELQNQALGLESHFASSPKTYDEMRNSLDNYRFGKEGEIEGEMVYGWSNNREMIIELFERLKQQLSTVKSPTPETLKGIRDEVDKRMETILARMNTAYNQYLNNVRRFGLIHRFKSLRMSLIDLLGLYGVYKHYYRFANERALFEKWKIKIGDGKKRDADEKIENDENGNPIRVSDGVFWSISSKSIDEAYEAERKSIENDAKDRILKDIKKEITKRMEQSLKMKFEADLYFKIEEYARSRLPASKRNEDFSEEMKKKISMAYEARKKGIPKQVGAELAKRESEIGEEAEKEFEKKEYQDKFAKAPELADYRINFVAELESLGPVRHEVDYQGFVLADIHEVEVGHIIREFIRRVKIEDIEEFPSKIPELSKYSWIAEQIKQEWDFLIEDLRWGTYHPYSHSDTDYTYVISERKSYNFDNIGKTRPGMTQQQAAFDLEALKIPGKFVYWGRKNYWDRAVELKNPYPTISSVGLSRFLTALVKLRCTETVADRYLPTFVWDTGTDNPPFTTVLGRESKEKHGN